MVGIPRMPLMEELRDPPLEYIRKAVSIDYPEHTVFMLGAMWQWNYNDQDVADIVMCRLMLEHSSQVFGN